jgi:hypothetical protein
MAGWPHPLATPDKQASSTSPMQADDGNAPDIRNFTTQD